MRFIVLMSALLLGACTASSSNPGVASNPKAGNIVCDRETPTGSHLSRTRCRTIEQMEADREDARKTLQRTRTMQPSTGGSQ